MEITKFRESGILRFGRGFGWRVMEIRKYLCFNKKSRLLPNQLLNMLIYNTLTKKKEEFKPIEDKLAKIYTCGPTVYWFAHIGNLRTYIFEDILKRVLAFNGYKYRHVMNITDVGHLTSDADSGEDKMEKGAKKEGKTAWEIADFYTQAFKRDLGRLNVAEPDVWVKATDTIKEQIELIQLLEKKGYTYTIEDGVYFDSSKVKDYGKLAGLKEDPAQLQSRLETVEGKKSPTDFALWKFSPKDSKRQMEWESPWGKGFPGWHTECIVMGAKYLDVPFDIHCGGIDHVPVHHTNEIAQAEAAWGNDLANYWMHGEFLVLKDSRMGKSEGNSITVETLVEKGFDPLAYRYLTLTAHYRTKLTFTLDDLAGAQSALQKLRGIVLELKKQAGAAAESEQTAKYRAMFSDYVNDDLNMPKALALVWIILKDQAVPDAGKYRLILEFDKVFGLDLDKVKEVEVGQEVEALVKERESYRQQKNWAMADEVRKKIEALGYQLEDSKDGMKIKKIK
jgi:cysteinyl-tRNA synthetase